MRNNSTPRFIGIPNPIAYAKQCQILSDNWKQITEYFKNKTDKDIFKVSRIHLRKLQDKPELFEMNYKNFKKDGSPEDDIVINSNYVAYADISNCFPSIYSHSISWALVGKKEAKEYKKDKEKWFNQIDSCTRILKNGETNGILIGPHSSSLISELILVDIDEKLVSKNFQYVRHIDDYKCYVDSHKQAEEFFLSLSEALKEYDLTLNHKKSKIISLPKASVGNWIDKLNCFNFKDFTYISKTQEYIGFNGVKFFINFAIELMLNEESDAAIINYAIQILAEKKLNTNAKSYYFKQIHHLVLLYPYLVRVLDKHIFNKHIFDKQKIKIIAIDIFHMGIKRKNYEACSFAVYWALKYDFEIEDIENLSLKSSALDSLDCIFMIISFLYDSKHRNNLYLQEYKDKASDLTKNDESDKYWLYIYEVLSINQTPKLFKSMKKEKISFIKEAFRIKRVTNKKKTI